MQSVSGDMGVNRGGNVPRVKKGPEHHSRVPTVSKNAASLNVINLLTAEMRL